MIWQKIIYGVTWRKIITSTNRKNDNRSRLLKKMNKKSKQMNKQIDKQISKCMNERTNKAKMDVYLDNRKLLVAFFWFSLFCVIKRRFLLNQAIFYYFPLYSFLSTPISFHHLIRFDLIFLFFSFYLFHFFFIFI